MSSAERFKGIEVFVEVCKLGSFTEAAEGLGVTSSAVSKAIARLEKRLKVRLFERTTRRLSLTSEGVNYYHACISVLNKLRKVECELSAKEGESQRRLRMHLPETFGREYVLSMIIDGVRQYPLLEPYITFATCEQEEDESNIDIAVRLGNSISANASLQWECLGKEKLVLCASSTYLKRSGYPASISDLTRHHCVAYITTSGRDNTGLENTAFKWLDQRWSRTSISVSDTKAALTATSAGMGIALLPTWIVQTQFDTGELVQVLPDFFREGADVCIGWSTERAAESRIQLLLDYLQKRLSCFAHISSTRDEGALR